MSRSLIGALLILLFAAVDSAFAQAQEEDVIILKDNTIVRGTLTQTVTPGSSVTIRRSSGKVSSLLWSEILAIRRLPVSMPDSAVAALFLNSGSGSKSPAMGAATISGGYSSAFGTNARDTTVEDILILANGRIVRGSIIESAQQGTTGLWGRDQKLTIFRNSEIVRKLHLERTLTDSTIDVLYIHPLPEMIADDFRIVTVFGGLSMAAGGFSTPSTDGADPAGSGFSVGIHASVRILPTIRWATTAIYSKNSMDFPEVLANYSAMGSADPYQLIWLVTGGEVRTEGTSLMKAFGFLQGGLLFSRISAFNVTIPQTVNHPPGTGGQEGASASSFAFCLGAGISVGRFSLTGRWLVSSASYDYKTTYDFEPYYGGPQTAEYKFDQPVSVIHVCIGFSPF
jgi:hypothetical protein